MFLLYYFLFLNKTCIKKIVPNESCHHSREKLKIVAMRSIYSHEK